jgi:hypothetical protein
MSSIRYRIAPTLAVAGIAATIFAPAGIWLGSTGAAAARESYICMTDDGYGRRRPCSADYKTQHPAWRGTDDCYTDDGYGRHRPCSANYRAKHKKG